MASLRHLLATLSASAVLLAPAASAHVPARPVHTRAPRHHRAVTHHPRAHRTHRRPPAKHPSAAVTRHALLAALRRRPSLIRDAHWLRQASAFDLQIPAFLRLSQLVDSAGDAQPSDDTATFDFSPAAAGVHTVRLDGTLPVLLTFQGSFGIGYPGDIQVSVPATTGAAPLVSGAVPLETDSYLSNPQSGSPGGCSDFAATGGYGATAAGVDDPAALGDFPSSVSSPDDVGPSPYDSLSSPADTAAQDVKVRTGPLALSVVGSNNGGTANLFGLAPAGQQPVRLQVNLAASVSTVIRVAPADPTYGALDTYLQCRQVWTGSEPYCTGGACGAVSNVFPAVLAGTMRMSPALSADGRIRLATFQLSTPSGQAQPVSLTACLDPYATFAAGSAGGLGPSATSPYVDPSTAAAAPAVACGAAGGPLAQAPFSWSPTGQSETLAGQFAVTNLTAELMLGS